MWKSLAAIAIFPFTLTAALVVALWVEAGGYVDDLQLISVLVLVVGAFWIWAWEYILPYRESWNRNDNDLGTDSIYMAVQLVITRLAKPLYVFLLFPVVTWLGHNVGAENLWPHDSPLLAQLVLVLVLAEFGRYWIHRAAHSVRFLWQFHAVHHSPNRLYWLNAGRFHPVEKFLFQIPELLPFILLNPAEEVLMLYLIVNGIHGFFQHSNIRMNIGWLNYVFSMTELHRWHHSKVIEQSDNNFGNILILWDIVFGTFFWPKQREVGSIGVMNPEYPKHFLGQLAAPFGDAVDKPDDYEARKDYYHKRALEESG